MGSNTSYTVDVVLHKDFWSEAARQAAAESRKRHASAGAGKAAARSAYGKKEGGKQLQAAAKAHGDLHGEDHGELFKQAAAAHTKRIAARHEAAKKNGKRVFKAGKGIIKSMLRAHENTKL